MMKNVYSWRSILKEKKYSITLVKDGRQTLFRTTEIVMRITAMGLHSGGER